MSTSIPHGGPKFALGRCVATPGALALLERTGASPAGLLARHLALEPGCLGRGDVKMNRHALVDGSRIFSAFLIGEEKVWIITDAENDSGHRESTCILLPEEY